jgi:plasmid stability protein
MAMNAITIRAISPQAIARIEELAALHRRSVEEEAADLLEKAVSGRAARLAAIDRIAAMSEARDQW